jgi:hypothetical protein
MLNQKEFVERLYFLLINFFVRVISQFLYWKNPCCYTCLIIVVHVLVENEQIIMNRKRLDKVTLAFVIVNDLLIFARILVSLFWSLTYVQ